MARYDVSDAFKREANRLDAIARGTSKAEERAAGTLARRLPVQARRDIQDEYTLTAARVRAGLRVSRGGGYVELRASARGIGLIEFRGRWRGRKTPGAVAQVFSGEAPYNYGGTFIAEGRSGNRQIFDRTTAKPLPLKTLYGPSLASMLRKPERRERLANFARGLLKTEVDRLNQVTG